MSFAINMKGGEDMKRKGFTLIELLVVIAIIGILATIGLVALNGAREKARDATRKSDISQVKTALVLYADDHNNAYPAAPSGAYSSIDANGTPTPNSIFDPSGSNPIVPSYISKAIGDPTNNLTFRYVYETCEVAGNSAFLLYARLESPGSGGPYYFWLKSDGTSDDGSTTVDTCDGT